MAVARGKKRRDELKRKKRDREREREIRGAYRHAVIPCRGASRNELTCVITFVVFSIYAAV